MNGAIAPKRSLATLPRPVLIGAAALVLNQRFVGPRRDATGALRRERKHCTPIETNMRASAIELCPLHRATL